MTVMKKSNKEDAVSPVIGVMLMLVVTIVIAAVVAAFASGLGGDVESAPAAAFDVDIGTNAKVKVQHLSGENLLISKMTVKVQNGDNSGDASFTETGFFTPGMTITSKALPTTVGINGDTKGKYVTVLIVYDGKHVIFNKDIMVQ
jgi:FlaG/FlaF family flagellin (archaellin)